MVLLLIITFAEATLSFLGPVKAETKIMYVLPTSGIVGSTVQIIANISTPNGQYKIMLGENEILSRNAQENNATVLITIPHASEGPHNLTLFDVSAGENDTEIFTVLTSYSFEPIVPASPAQPQEGANVTITVNMTGGKSNYTYPNVTIQTPSGNLAYEATKNITTTVVGDFCDNLTYPNDFSNGASTNFTGEYRILFNETLVSQFFIGLTNASEYHRGEILNAKAVDYYPPNDNVTVTIKLGDKLIYTESWNVTDGIVNLTWPIPLNATIGYYNLSITPIPKSKENASDTQTFWVPGFKTRVLTLDLANKTIPDIFVKAYDTSGDAYYSNTSDPAGLAVLMLEIGEHSCEAFFKDVRVGEINFTISKEDKWNLTCQLTTMNINVIDAQNLSIPKVPISLSYNYTTNLGEKKNETHTDFGETNITGTLQMYPLLPNVTYAINASRYGEVFNQDNNTLPDLSAMAYVDVTIFCPVRTLQVSVIDGRNRSIENVIVNAKELMGGLSYSANTDVTGTTILNCTFGKYVVKVFVGEILLNETTVDLFQNQSISMICQLYGLTMSVKVVDYFGQPISNANVTLHREGLEPRSAWTQSDGMAIFENIIGGNLQIVLYLWGQTHPLVTSTFFVDNSVTTYTIKIEKYVLLAGLLVETSQLTTAIIIILALVLIVSIEVYRRKRVKPQKGES